MLHFHYCKKYKSVVDSSIDESVRKLLKSYTNRNSLKGIGKISSFTNSIFILLIKRPVTEVILQEERILIDGKEEVFYFVRDLKKGLSDYVEIRDGKWINYNTLPEEEKETAIENYKKSKQEKTTPLTPPNNLISWQKDYKLNVKYTIYEAESWVYFATNDSPKDGMVFSDVKLYGVALQEILFANELEDRTALNKTNNSETYSFILNDIGIIYTAFKLEGHTKYLLESGANIKTQNEHWQKQLNVDYSTFYETHTINTISDLSSIALKAYPEWVLKDLNLWFNIEKSNEVGNLSLLPEQTNFLKNFKFPKYINGQAGSGKSTMLYYLFANSYYYKYGGDITGDILFLTENKRLLKHTQDAVYELLLNNPEFDLTSEDIAIVNVKKHFWAFKDFLLSFLPEYNKQFKGEYLNFSRFKLLYEDSNISKHIKNKYSAELVWFVISTYVYGYDLEYNITSDNYQEKMPKEGKELIDIEQLKGIEAHIIHPFYKKLLEKGYWDKITLIKYLSDNNLINRSFDVIFCDEAQDFCRVELNFILKLSSYVQYDLSNVKQFPIVFAGDALQTVNPTGFKTSTLTSMIHRELKDLGYKIEGDIDFTPQYNYRSSQTIVNLANAVQYYRKTELGADVKFPQKSKRPTFYENKNLNVFIDIAKLKEDVTLQTKLKHKTIILPVNDDFIETYKKENPILKEYNNLISAVDAKGIDFKEVAIFGFGKYYDDNWGTYEKRYFFNKLYVAVTRAQAELVIIDDLASKEIFWQKLVEKYLGSEWVREAPSALNEFEDIISDTGDVIQSSEKVINRDAERQKIQGEQDRNIPLLKLASSHFIKLGKIKEYYLCLAIIEEIRKNWGKAAEYFLNKEVGEEGIEKAADAYWNGQLWGKLKKLSGTIKNEKSQLRLLISKLFSDDELKFSDLISLNDKKEEIRKILNKTPWRDQIIKKFLSLIKNTINDEDILIIGEILECICYDKESFVWEILGEKYFEIHRYELAINTFARDNIQSISLLKANLESAKRKNNVEEIIVWLGRIILETKSDEFNDLLEFYSKNKTKIEQSDNIYAWLYIYFASLSKELNSSKLLPLAIKIEKYFETKEGGFADEIGVLLENFNFDDRIFNFLLRRWAKNSIIGGITLDGFNERYEELTLSKDIDFIPFTEKEIQNLPILPENIGDKPPNHIKNIKINNFRRFKNIQVSNLGMFNLIVGDNNVGKTSLLEALLFIPDKKEYLQRLAFAHIERVNLHPEKEGSSLSNNNILYYNLNKDFLQEFQDCEEERNDIVFLLKEGRNVWKYELFFNRNDENQGETILSFSKDDYNVFEKLSYLSGIKQPFMPYGKGFSSDLASVYDIYIRPKRNLEEDFKKNMQIFIPGISQIFASVDGNIDIRDNDFPEDRPLHQYGEGANKLFRILILLTLHKGKRLMIDEIDAGIHYSKFKEFWKLIIKIAKKDNTQVFATTHNDECIRYFTEVLDELGEEYQKEAKVVQMKLVNKNIKVRSYGYESFNLSIEEGIEIRGGQTL